MNDVGEKCVFEDGAYPFSLSTNSSRLGGESLVNDDSSLMSYRKGVESTSPFHSASIFPHFLSEAVPAGSMREISALSNRGPSQNGPRGCSGSRVRDVPLSRVERSYFIYPRWESISSQASAPGTSCT